MSAKNNSNTLCFNDYDVFGFDLDHTLAKYNLTNLFDVSLNLFWNFHIDFFRKGNE